MFFFVVWAISCAFKVGLKSGYRLFLNSQKKISVAEFFFHPVLVQKLLFMSYPQKHLMLRTLKYLFPYFSDTFLAKDHISLQYKILI